jgi:hypothetical protein
MQLVYGCHGKLSKWLTEKSSSHQSDERCVKNQSAGAIKTLNASLGNASCQ